MARPSPSWQGPQETEAKWKQFLEDRIEEAKEQDAQSAAYLIAYDEAEERVNVPLLTNSSTDPNYELVFFAVGDAARGYGVGSKLLSSAQNYLSSEGGKTAFLFTDTTCTWEYYERRGMRSCSQEWQKQTLKTFFLKKCLFTKWIWISESVRF